MARNVSSTTIESGIAGAIVLVALIAGSLLIPEAVDNVATDANAGAQIVRETAARPDQIRIGYLLAVIALLSIGPATSHLRGFAPERGHVATDIGLRLVRLGSLFGAVGNAFAPLILPSTVGFDVATMGRFVYQHETSATSYAILAVYGLLPIGGICLAVGLFRANRLPRILAIGLGLSVGALMPLRFGWQIGVDAVVLAVCLGVVWYLGWTRADQQVI